jgi:hypothetical protein
MEFRWQRAAYLASDIFPLFEHVHDITDLPDRRGTVGDAAVVDDDDSCGSDGVSAPAPGKARRTG